MNTILIQSAVAIFLFGCTWAKGDVVLYGFYYFTEGTTTVKNQLRITGGEDAISVLLQREVQGTKEPEATDRKAELTFNDQHFLAGWMQKTRELYRHFPRRGNAVDIEFPDGSVVLYFDMPPPPLPGPDPPAVRDAAAEKWLRETFETLNSLIRRGHSHSLITSRSEGDTVPARNVSLKELLNNPDKWDGQRVRVVAWCAFEFEEHAMYLSRFRRSGKEGVWIGGPSSIAPSSNEPEKFKGWREIEGVYRKSKRGHLGSYSGTIDRVTRNRDVGIWERLVGKPGSSNGERENDSRK